MTGIPPSLRTGPEQLVREALNQLTGAIGDPGQRAVRLDELLKSGVLQRDAQGGVRAGEAIERLEGTFFGINGIVEGLTEGLQTLISRVDNVDGTLTLSTEALAALRTKLTISDLVNGQLRERLAAESDAVQSLLSRVTASENRVDVLSRHSTGLNASLGISEGAVSFLGKEVVANASATQTLEARVTLTEEELVAQATFATALRTDITAAEGNITTIQGVNSAQGTAISTLETRATAAEGSLAVQSGDITALDSRLLTAEGNITAGANATNALTTRVATEEGKSTAQASSITSLSASTDAALNPAANLINNPSGELGTAGWSTPGSLTVVQTAGQETFLRSTVSGVPVTRVHQWDMAAVAGESYTFSLDVFLDASLTGTGYIDLLFYNAADAVILDTPGTPPTLGTWDRISETAQAPTGAVRMSARLVLSNASWTGTVGFRRAKLERSATMTPFDQDSLLANTTANAATNATANAALTARVNNTGGGKSIEVVASDLVALTTTVGGKAESSALTTLDSRVGVTPAGFTSFAGKITALDTTIAGKAAASALQTLDSQVNDPTSGLPTRASASAVTTLTARVDTAGNPNLIPNPTGAGGFDGYAFIGAGQQQMHVRTELYGVGGKMFACSFPSAAAIDQGISHTPLVDHVFGGGNVTFSADMDATNMLTGSLFVELRFYNASGVQVGVASRLTATNGLGWKRYSATLATPATAVKFTAIQRVSGTGNVGTFVGWRNAKLETGSIATGFSDDKTFTSSVTAVQSLTVDTATLKSQWNVTLDVSGYVSGLSSVNNGSYAEFGVLADKFKIAKPGGGAAMTWDTGVLWNRGASQSVIMGQPFGVSGDIMLWCGPNPASVAAASKANATIWFDSVGDAYFGGSISAGALSNSIQTTVLALPTDITLGPFGTNGGAKTVLFSYLGEYSQTKPGNVVSTYNGKTVTTRITRYRTIGAAAETSLGTFDVTKVSSATYDLETNTTSILCTVSGSSTYTDNSTSLSDFKYRAAAAVLTDTLGLGRITQKLSVLSTEG